MSSIRILLDRIIDYAGLFPPAALEMEQAVRNFAAYRKGRYEWLLGRFVLPASRLSDFQSAAAGLLPEEGSGSTWWLSALAGADLASEIQSILDFNTHLSRYPEQPPAQIDTVEIKISSLEEIDAAAKLLPPGIQAYFEIPAKDPSSLLAEIAGVGARAKVRTGGVAPESILPAVELERFIRACGAAHLSFKATAGLHHALRSVYALTYDSDGPSGIMHGFLNVFLASALIRSGLAASQAVRLLEEESIHAFRFDGRAASWRLHRISNDEISDTRRSFAISFGSCSFEEPIDDLKRLGLLPSRG